MAGGMAFSKMLEEDSAMSALTSDTDHHMLGAALILRQNIYDGGASRDRKQMLKTSADVEKSQVGVSLYNLRNRVDEIFFGIISMQRQIALQTEALSDLRTHLTTTESLLSQGIASENDRDEVRVAILSAQADSSQAVHSLNSMRIMLGALIGKDFTSLEEPPLPLKRGNGRRPEEDLYDARLSLLDAKEKSLSSSLMPKVSLMGAAVAHSKMIDSMKGANLFGGITLSWSISPLYTRKRDLARLETDRLEVKLQRDAFLFEKNLGLSGSTENEMALREAIGKDSEIVSLREDILRRDTRRFEEGLISASELLKASREAKEARILKSIREVKLLQELYRYESQENTPE